MNVSAIIVTRGDVELQGIIDSLPKEWEIVIWDNGERRVSRSDGWAEVCEDLSVYGRYAAIEYASHDLIYVQDDDVIVSDPQAIVDGLIENRGAILRIDRKPVPQVQVRGDLLVANMPQEFRHDGYTDSCLVGFGAAFHRDLPGRAFTQWYEHDFDVMNGEGGWFNRTCDVVFTTLTPRVLVDVPKKNLPCSNAPNRMWKQPNHVGERARMLELARQVRDA